MVVRLWWKNASHWSFLEPLNAGENCIDLFKDEKSFYCVLEGSVLRPYARNFTTGITAMQIERGSILIEMDVTCFRLAFAQLQMLAFLIIS